MAKIKNPSLFDRDDFAEWRDEWQDMPEFVQEDLMSFRDIIVHFRNQEDVNAFFRAIEQQITPNLKFIWYPELEYRKVADKKYIDEP